MPATITTLTHASDPAACMARFYGGCERAHVGDVVRVVVGPQLGYMQYGNVVAIDRSYVTVNFPEGAALIDDIAGDDLDYTESELEIVSA